LDQDARFDQTREQKMGYTTENKQDATVELVLQNPEKVFTSSKAADQLGSIESKAQASTGPKAEIYFQIED
jgi:hypothetical protein